MQINTSSVPLTGNTASVCFCSHPSVGNADRHMLQLRENVSMSTRANFKLPVRVGWGTQGWVAFARAQAA